MKSVKLTATAVCVAILCALLSACGGGGGSKTGTGSSRPSVTLSSISVTPATASFAAGMTQQLTATAKYSDGTTKDISATATWSSSATAVATVSAAGLVTGKTEGSATITAQSGSVTGTATMTVTAPVLQSITVTPDNASVALGRTQQFTAMGHYSNNTDAVVTGVTWNSSDNTKVQIAANGTAATKVEGEVTITATLGNISDTTTFHVTAPELNAILVTTPTPQIAQGQNATFTAFAVWTDGSSRDITTEATWTSSSETIASLNGPVAHGLAQGTANITATFNSISNFMALTVTQATLQTIEITPDLPTINVGGEVQLTATGNFTDGSSQELTNVTWTSSADTFASVSATGLVKGLAASVAPITIEASVNGITDSVLLTVDPALLLSIAVDPADSAMAVGTSRQFLATGTFSDGSMQDLAGVLWNSSAETVATIGATTGMAKALGVGSTNIAAESGVISGSTTLSVTGAVLSRIIVTPAVPALGVGATVQFTATGEYTDSTTQDITALVTWTSSNAAVATVDRTGNATAISMGGATISASLENMAGSTLMTVTPATIVSIDVLPNTPQMATRTKLQMRVVATFSDETTRELTSGVIWSSSTGRVASVSGRGLVRSKKVGTARIRATVGTKSGEETVTVTNANLTRIEIQPSAAKVAARTKAQFRVIGYFSDGVTTQDLTNSVRWTSSNGTIATVATTGLVSTWAPGTVTITATYNTMVTSATLEVSNATLTALTITAPAAEIALGTAVQFTATGSFSDGSEQNLTREVVWTSASPQVAIIDAFGLATSSGRGTTEVTASFGSVSSGATTLTVK